MFWIFFSCQDESVEAGLTHPMVSLMKRSKALRFYGLMGKRSGGLNSFLDKKDNCFFVFLNEFVLGLIILYACGNEYE